MVHEDPAQAPFFKTADDETWKANAYQPTHFCRNTDRAEELYEQQLSTPRPTQLRYFLEYLTDDLSERLLGLQVPLLVVDPVRQGVSFDGTEVGFEALLDENVDANLGQFEGLSREQVKTAMREQILQRFGTIEAFAEATRASARPWDSIVQANPLVTLEEIPNTGIFVMEDQPRRLDELIAAFAAESVGRRQSKH